MTLQEFVNKYNNQSNIGNTPDNKGECVGLVMVWVSSIGSAHVWGHAKDLFTNAGVGYEKIKNADDLFVQGGDIVVWNSNMGGGYGHTAVATGKNNGDAFEVLEQNNPTGAGVRLHTYSNYANVIGWLRPLTVQQPTMDQRPYWFDLINKVIWDKPHEEITDQMVNDWTANYKSERERSHKWSVAVNSVFGVGTDSNKITPTQLIDKVKSTQTGNTTILAQQLADCQAELKAEKDKYYKLLSDITNLIEKAKNET